MNEMRKLMESISKIEESHHSRLAQEIEELRKANSNLSPTALVNLARHKYGQEAATYLSDKLELEGDLGFEFDDYIGEVVHPGENPLDPTILENELIEMRDIIGSYPPGMNSQKNKEILQDVWNRLDKLARAVGNTL